LHIELGIGRGVGGGGWGECKESTWKQAAQKSRFRMPVLNTLN